MSGSNSMPSLKSEQDSDDQQLDTIPPRFASREGAPSPEPLDHTATQAYDPFRTRQPTLTDDQAGREATLEWTAPCLDSQVSAPPTQSFTPINADQNSLVDRLSQVTIDGRPPGSARLDSLTAQMSRVVLTPTAHFIRSRAELPLNIYLFIRAHFIDHGETRGSIFDQLAAQNVFVHCDVQQEIIAQLSFVVILMQRYPEGERTEEQTEELVNAIRMLTVQYPEYQWQWPENNIGNLPRE